MRSAPTIALIALFGVGIVFFMYVGGRQPPVPTQSDILHEALASLQTEQVRQQAEIYELKGDFVRLRQEQDNLLAEIAAVIAEAEKRENDASDPLERAEWRALADSAERILAELGPAAAPPPTQAVSPEVMDRALKRLDRVLSPDYLLQHQDALRDR